MTGSVLSRAGGTYRVFVDDEILDVSLRGRLKHRDKSPRVLVGDRVRLRVEREGATIEEVLERSSLLKRRSPGRSRGTRDIAANVDQVSVVGSADQPPWDQHTMDRFVAVAEANSLPAVVVVNKCDLVADCDLVGEVFRRIGYPVVCTSVETGLGIQELCDVFLNETTLLTGPSGVGKSTILNAVEPGLGLRTSPVAKRTKTGRHTTVSAEMFPLSGGGFVVDTPGLRDIGLWALEPHEVQRAFPEIAHVGSGCRFDDCRHSAEPDCAVRSAVAAGEVFEKRLESFGRLLAEAEAARKQW